MTTARNCSLGWAWSLGFPVPPATHALCEGWGRGGMATTKAHWAQEAHRRPSESQGPVLHIKMRRGLCKITHVHPKPTRHPIHTRAHAHTCTNTRTHTYPVLGPCGPRPQVLLRKGRNAWASAGWEQTTLQESAKEQPDNQNMVLLTRPST